MPVRFGSIVRGGVCGGGDLVLMLVGVGRSPRFLGVPVWFCSIVWFGSVRFGSVRFGFEFGFGSVRFGFGSVLFCLVLFCSVLFGSVSVSVWFGSVRFGHPRQDTTTNAAVDGRIQRPANHRVRVFWGKKNIQERPLFPLNDTCR